ncbi:unnamed protein product [Urochloa humidicola]
MSAGGEKKRTACVTGGNGYIASALIKMLLEKGYAVKTTVRNPDDMAKNSRLKDLQALGPLEVFHADLEEEGSFDKAIAGCHYAFLVAAPVNFHSKNPEKELIEPAVRGTLNVMQSCAKAGTMKRVVLTSSVAAVCNRPLEGAGHVLDEDSWSDVDYLITNKPSPWVRTVSFMSEQTWVLLMASLHFIAGIPGLEGAPREGSEQVRGGARNQPRHRLARRYRRLGTDSAAGPRQPLLALRSVRQVSGQYDSIDSLGR